MALTQKRVRVTIDPKGNFTLEAKEGFSGESCMEKTRTIEMALGGLQVEEGKTNAYYDPDDANPVSIEFGDL